MIAEMLTQMVPFVRTVGIEIGETLPGEAQARLPAREEVQNHLGTAHAGAVYSLGETASGAVVLSLFADLLSAGVFVALRSAEVRHLKAAPGDVKARARVVGDAQAPRATYDASGRVDFQIEVELHVNELHVAQIVYTWAVRAPRE